MAPLGPGDTGIWGTRLQKCSPDIGYDLDFNAGGTLKRSGGKHVTSQVTRWQLPLLSSSLLPFPSQPAFVCLLSTSQASREGEDCSVPGFLCLLHEKPPAPLLRPPRLPPTPHSVTHRDLSLLCTPWWGHLSGPASLLCLSFQHPPWGPLVLGRPRGRDLLTSMSPPVTHWLHLLCWTNVEGVTAALGLRGPSARPPLAPMPTYTAL